MAGFLFFSKGRNLAWFLLVNLAIFENPQNFSRAARAGFYFFQKFPENRSGFLFFSILGGGKNSGFFKRGEVLILLMLKELLGPVTNLLRSCYELSSQGSIKIEQQIVDSNPSSRRDSQK